MSEAGPGSLMVVITLAQCFSTGGHFVSPPYLPRGHLSLSKDMLYCYHQGRGGWVREEEDATGIYWVKAQNAAKYPLTYRTAPHKNK